HGAARVRRHHGRPAVRARPVRDDLRDHDGLCRLREPQARPRRHVDSQRSREAGGRRMNEWLTSVGSSISAAVVEIESNPILNMSIFAVFVAVTMFIVIRASRNNRSADDYYAGGRSFSG